FGMIVAAGYAPLVPADVLAVEAEPANVADDGLDDAVVNARFVHVRRYRVAQIMMAPRCNGPAAVKLGDVGVEIVFQARVVHQAPGPAAEYQVPAWPLGKLPQDVDRPLRQRQFQVLPVLGAALVLGLLAPDVQRALN